MAVSISQVRRWGALAAALVLVSLALAACGGGDGDSGSTAAASGGGAATQATGSGGSGGTTLVETAQESGGLSFSRSDLTARAGSVTLTIDNPSGNQLPHAIEIEGNGVEEETTTVQPGGRASTTVNLRPGRYTFYCPVGSHRQAGMEGTLTVS